MNNRYKVPSSEDYEPDSNNEVLKNKLNIKSKEVMNELEARELMRCELEMISFYDENHCFTSKDICSIHKKWLANIYSFAGKYRTVTMEKDGFPFANPMLIPKLMQKFATNYLTRYTPLS